MNKLKYFSILLTILFILPSFTSFAKKKPDFDNPRVKNLSGEDKVMFDELTKKQQNKIRNGEIEKGWNAWMIELSIGSPYYKSENHPVFVDYEQVWLYTKDRIEQKDNEEKIIDPVTNWPSIHKVKWTKTCKVGDFFLLFDRGVVDKIVNDKSDKIYGSCTINTSEEFIPIKN